ncbi:polyheme membrane-associated cytochrome C [Halovulum dunhuangense]|uniref:Polyheme membrane-associated cytochrome C n=1 Tax=Halovulum dunhuangense TaxID=1505036 RepID=A0A849L7E9_9RHOB|nr:polyheme membrane-associated cytochrome C [Halovulum dunhuangense]NNU81981.1 polyheme membrane-associated cytochrome C [Halovulum dunhuangense]
MRPARFLSGLAAFLVLAAMPLAAQDRSLAEIVEAWLDGPHGDYRSPAFTHWNPEGEVPAACAACHSESGMLDWLGADGSAPLAVEHPGTINTVIGCAACHVSEAGALDAVPFPSGVTVGGLGSSATCTVCHQGRASADSVASATDGMDPDAVSPDLRFINVHYGVAAAVLHGADARGGFEYPGRDYAGRFRHVPSVGSCVACHEPHTTEVDTGRCFACHQGTGDITGIRTRHADFDGDGVTSGGIASEIEGLHAVLGNAIATYAREIAGSPIGYAPGRFPYFFNDSDGDGAISDAEALGPNRYASWTPRLLMAAYNYQLVARDGGAWVHNPAYAIQLLHDSIASLADVAEVGHGRLSRP